MSTATDDFIRSSGNLAYVNTWLKLIALVLLLVCLMLGAALLVKIIDGRAEHVVPIVINQATGDAIAVDYRVVDAAGEERSPFEVRKFCEDFLAEAYTYNRYTVKTKLESIARWTAPEALTQVREALNLSTSRGADRQECPGLGRSHQLPDYRDQAASEGAGLFPRKSLSVVR